MFQAEDTYQFLWLLLIIPIGLLVWLAISWKNKTLKKMGDGHLVRQLFVGYSSQKFMLKAILPLIAMVFLALALVNYRKADDSEKIKLNGTDLMIVLDVSNSMLAKDVQPNRLEKAKLLIGKLIDQLNGNRVGLIVFAGNAYPQMPLTTDASAAKLFLGSISPDLVPTQGTNISEALLLADRMMNSEEKKYKSILLISDGEDHDADAEITAKQLKDHGVIINTIGIGSPEGAQLYDPATNDVKRDAEGNIVISKLNEKALQDLAAATGGSYQLLGETETAVKNILAQLDSMDKKAITDTTFTNYKTYFYWFVAVSMVLLLMELFISEKKKKEGTKMNKPAKKAMVAAMLLMTVTAFSQKENDIIRKGNEAYKKQQFDVASKDYAEALKQNNNNATANFNLGNTWFKAGKYDTAAQQYDALANAPHSDKSIAAKSYYNKGVSLVKDKKLKEAIDAFKQSLKVDPSDEDSRQNLQKALKELQKQQPPPPQNKQDKKKQDEKKPPPPKEDKKKNDGEQPPPQSKLNKKEAEQKLQALREEEKKLKQKMDQQKQPGARKTDKDW
jgi:Ca-activated chloride channel family protein